MPPAVALVGTLASAAVAGAAAVGISSSALTAFAISAALSGAQYLLARTQTDREGLSTLDSPAGINSPEVRSSVKQATPAQQIVFGETRIGGAFFFYEVIPPYLYLGLMHSSKRITEYVTLYIADTVVLLDSNSEPFQAPFFTSSDIARLQVATQTGTLTQGVNSIIASDFSSLGTSSPEEFRLPGIANTVFRFDYGADFDEFESLWGNVQIPNAQWVVRGAPVYDPREPTHTIDFDPRDVEELDAAEATWSYSNNAALIQAYWAMMPFGLNAGPGNIDWDKVCEAANFDDEDIGLKDGGFQKRHTIDGVVKLNQKPSTVMEAMLTANRGFIIQRGGKFWNSSSQPRDAIHTIIEDDIIGGFEYRTQKPKRDLANVVRVRFVAPDRQYQQADGPIRTRTDLVVEDGETLDQTITLPFTSTSQRAERIAKAFLEDARLGKALTIRVSLRAIGLDPGDVVRLSFENYSPVDGLYSVESWSLAEDLASIDLTLTEYDAAIARNWTPATDESDFELQEASE